MFGNDVGVFLSCLWVKVFILKAVAGLKIVFIGKGRSTVVLHGAKPPAPFFREYLGFCPENHGREGRAGMEKTIQSHER